METSFQKIIAAVVGVMILFIIPVYIAFEKVDDVSYSLALKLTQNFVDNVRDKGYISPEMYSDFVSGLYATNNAYDVSIEHIKKRYDPAIYIYDIKADGSKGRLLHILDYNRYAPDGKLPEELTIDVGIYNVVNSNIYEKPASMTKADGSQIDFTNGGTEILTAEELYKLKIDQFRRLDRIILDQGEIYADVTKVTGENFDKEIYIPSNITLNPGVITVKNKQGNEPDTLNYNTYIGNYDKAVKNNTLFNGPTYNSTNSKIDYVPASMRIKGRTMTDTEANELYYDWINRYNIAKSNGDGRIIESTGEIYADRDRVIQLGGTLDTKLDIISSIYKSNGYIVINPDKQLAGYETMLDYDTYIQNYNNNEDMVVFEGEIYDNQNSDIEVTRAAMWTSNKDYSELTAGEKDEAEKLYQDKINDDAYVNDDTIVLDKGEIYAESEEAIGYNKLTDNIRNVNVVGEIKVKNPTGFDPEYLDFSKYIQEFRDTGKIVYESGNTYTNEEDGVEIIHTPGSIKDIVTGKSIDYDSCISQYMDDSISEITVPRIVGYTKDDIYVYVYFVIKNLTTQEKEYRSLNGNYIDELKRFSDHGEITIRGKTYALDEYDISIQNSMSFIVLEKDETINEYIFYDEDGINEILNDYYENGMVTRDYSKTYPKDDLKVEYENLTINKDGEELYKFYEYQSPEKYNEYLIEFNYTGSIAIDEKIFEENELNVKYAQIDIQGRESIVVDNTNLTYVEDYYNNKRIVITPASLASGSQIKVQHARIDIYKKGTSDILYKFRENIVSENSDYIKYLKEYNSDKTITIDPARIYKPEDVTVIREKLVITPEDTSKNKEIEFEDDNAKYQDYLSQFESTGKIIVSEPEAYNIYDDLEVQDAHIAITPTGYSKPIIDIYENNNLTLYNNYTSQYLSNGAITLQYNISDISVYRANVTIQTLKLDEPSNTYVSTGESPKIIYDNIDSNGDGVYEYYGYKNEYENKGLITFATAKQYTADELKVVDPTITITDPNNGSVIVKYEADFDSLDEYDRYLIYNQRVEEYGENSQLIDQTITYKKGENCIIEKAHVVNEEHITDKQIVAKLFKDTGLDKTEFLRQCLLGNGDMYSSLAYLNENSYIMNEGDQIYVTVKNRNKTIASTFYSLFTANVGDEEVAKIYVDYGGTVRNSGNAQLIDTSGTVDSEEGRLFKYQGQPEEVTLAPGRYRIECWGASGGYKYESTKNNQLGAYTSAIYNITKETTLYVYVGGKGTLYSDSNQNNGGYNGGGSSYNGGGGGGATDVRLIKNEWDDTTSLLSRIVVAGGGGGASGYSEYGVGGIADHGNQNYRNGNREGHKRPYNGIGVWHNQIDTITTGYDTYTEADGTVKSIDVKEKGSLGKGGSVDFDGAGAGGAGYIGGSAAHNKESGGGAGSSYVYQNNTYANKYDLNKRYPVLKGIAYNYDIEVLEGIRTLMGSDNRFLGIQLVESAILQSGGSGMPNPLTYIGSSTMTGNIGNGYARIKKIS